ncbi:pilus assembly protein TadG-related protein [Candidatus Poriferisodalis sp.]|uniref:pilus assembly protein TadG-related protein n=1 Tax=Candidatus Poriferisodalis sp. TaxID=3101277 RepID=UPI003B020CB3
MLNQDERVPNRDAPALNGNERVPDRDEAGPEPGHVGVLNRGALVLSSDEQVPNRNEAGSGTAIGVAIMFPALMLVIMVLHAITTATRTEQALQAVADRAAHAASLCCVNVAGARDTAEQTVEAHTRGLPIGRLDCANDADPGRTDVSFFDVAGAEVRATVTDSDPPVPAGGTVIVRVVCELPARVGGGLSPLRGNVERSAVGMATVDPYRHRHTRAPAAPAGG